MVIIIILTQLMDGQYNTLVHTDIISTVISWLFMKFTNLPSLTVHCIGILLCASSLHMLAYLLLPVLTFTVYQYN